MLLVRQTILMPAAVNLQAGLETFCAEKCTHGLIHTACCKMGRLAGTDTDGFIALAGVKHCRAYWLGSGVYAKQHGGWKMGFMTLQPHTGVVVVVGSGVTLGCSSDR